MQALPDLPVIPSIGNPCVERGCSKCCHDTEMLLTEDDVRRISAVRPDMEFYFQAPDGFLQLRTRQAPAAAGGPAGTLPCTFLHPDGSCTIHQWRPEGCRLYPGIWDSDTKVPVLDDQECPHTDAFALDADAMDGVARLAATLVHERKERLTKRPRPKGQETGRDGLA